MTSYILNMPNTWSVLLFVRASVPIFRRTRQGGVSFHRIDMFNSVHACIGMFQCRARGVSPSGYAADTVCDIMISAWRHEAVHAIVHQLTHCSMAITYTT